MLLAYMGCKINEIEIENSELGVYNIMLSLDMFNRGGVGWKGKWVCECKCCIGYVRLAELKICKLPLYFIYIIVIIYT